MQRQRSSSLQQVQPETEARTPSDIMGRAMRAAANVAPEVFTLTGIVKWFDGPKGFGFIVPDNGMSDVLLHVACLRRSGYETVYEGTKISCEATRKQKGLQCVRVLSVDNSAAILSKPKMEQISSGVVTRIFGPERMMVKFFNRPRGFGFFECHDASDVFVHMEILRHCGIDSLVEGQDMMVSYGPNNNDPQHRLWAVHVAHCGG